jgi:cytochrome c oxidase assembly protein subunit 15
LKKLNSPTDEWAAMTTYSYYTPHAFENRGDRGVGLWLLFTAAMIFAMAVIGAITRLTESGLSIMEWAPISGTLPPMSQAEWERLFELYKTIPEYQMINQGMSLADFKEIFWWEWIHRLWGRLIGLVYALPLVVFALRGRIDRERLPHLVAVFLLGALQGGIGWYMVASGFSERDDVSQYRLALHLSLALLIYAYVLWLAFGYLRPRPETSEEGQRLKVWLVLLALLICVTLVSGAFVAGLNAGFIYNSFPLMGDRLAPPEYAAMEPFLLNFFENIAAVQFNHRLLAGATLLGAVGLFLASRPAEIAPAAKAAFTLLALAAVTQFVLGVSALLMVVPVWLGALHQAGAILLLSATLWALYNLRSER